MKPIETIWKGYRFRSRTEARWAVFLEAADIQFEYEPEGVILPSGPYLPDFRLRDFPLLPAMAERSDVWLEIKGDSPTADERMRCNELAEASGCPVLLAVGAPDFAQQVYLFDPDVRPFMEGLAPTSRITPAEARNLISLFVGPLAFMVVGDASAQAICVGRGPRDSAEREQPNDNWEHWATYDQCMAAFDEEFCYVLGVTNGRLPRGVAKMGITKKMRDAYDKSRSARFEFGQIEARWAPVGA